VSLEWIRCSPFVSERGQVVSEPSALPFRPVTHEAAGSIPVARSNFRAPVLTRRLSTVALGRYITGVTFTIELEREEDGRWIAEVPALPGVLCYGQDRGEAVAGVQALALRDIAERLENREAPAEFINVTFQAA
jgi:predicted RNase H-like HicB family nuclease